MIKRREKQSSVLSRKRGFTLVEVMVAALISGVVLATATGSLLFLAKSTAGIANYQEMNMTTRYTLELFASDARMTADVNFATSTTVSLEVYDSSGALETVIYSYDPDNAQFSRTVGGATRILLSDVDSVDLKYFTLRRDETTVLVEMKEIQLQVVMSRNVLNVGNTNEILSARFMMRNRSVSS